MNLFDFYFLICFGSFATARFVSYLRAKQAKKALSPASGFAAFGCSLMIASAAHFGIFSFPMLVSLLVALILIGLILYRPLPKYGVEYVLWEVIIGVVYSLIAVQGNT